MTTTSTATVESLTAQIQVLKVDARRITVAIAKQLDIVPLEEVEIMGRIRLTGKVGGRSDRRYESRQLVIGRHDETGALVLADAWEPGTPDCPNRYAAAAAPLIVLAGLR